MTDKPFSDAPRVEGRVIYGWWPDCEAWFPVKYVDLGGAFVAWMSADGGPLFPLDDHPFTHWREVEPPQ